MNIVKLNRSIAAETGFGFTARSGVDRGEEWVELFPLDLPKANTFSIKAVVGWRHIEVAFTPGAFSLDLIRSMGSASQGAKEIFSQIIDSCISKGAEVSIDVNGSVYRRCESTIWDSEWTSASFRFRAREMDLEELGRSDRDELICAWVGTMAAAVISLMPLENPESDEMGLPEGATVQIRVNKYERDPRNRAAALSIHGSSCNACGIAMSKVYGEIAEGYIEVHHVTPVSQLGQNYLVNPVTDLVPLCPNCHAIAHLQEPPFTLDELRDLVEKPRRD